MQGTKEFKKGVDFRNIFNTTQDPPTDRDKGLVHKNRTKCVFCDGDYAGLNHVIPNNTPFTLGGETNTYYLAPGCQACNKSLGVLTLRETASLIVPERPRCIVVEKCFVMKYE